MAEARVELPDGHLVNLSPRPTRQSPYKAYRADYKASPTELSATSPPRYAQDARSNGYANSRSASDNTYQKSKATKLPVPRSIAESQSNELRQTPSPTGLPKPITPSHSGQRGQTRSSDRDHDQYLRKLRDKFEKESPLSQRSTRGKESDTEQSPNSRISYHRTRPTAATRTIPTSSREGTTRSGIPSPSTATKSSPAQGVKSTTSASHPVDSKNKWRKQGDQWINMDVPDNDTPQISARTDTTADSSPRSHPSISPVSAEDSSITDWEDRFVVNMPTAKDPNPPTMTAQQISEYQKSIERVHQTGGRMVDPNSLPSRTTSPESKLSLRSHREHIPTEFRAYDGTYEETHMPSSSRDEPRQLSPPQQPQYQQQPDPQPQAQPTAAAQHRQATVHYYSPDEIGHNRISTIWEESPTKVKQKRHPQNADGSFLGCREISGEKNPDEILMFASPDDASLHPRPLALASKNKHRQWKEVKKGIARQTMHRVEETIVLQEERPEISQNSKPAQCSKSSTIFHDQNYPPKQQPIPRTGSQNSGKENFHPPAVHPNDRRA
ncbi:uncharacterized protein N7529_000324 [Penicillium soppii]|uniref:uncharacterized protein n=1 Tax=Penicillium soppii TaxID=69789 RepID=UPI0025486FF3|nr:uncharacterized protein N7529_000324 [Penicillium soppii]KAJ5881652.1 hypothetical protein N7529_000324 [Penicillium soppii]